MIKIFILVGAQPGAFAPGTLKVPSMSHTSGHPLAPGHDVRPRTVHPGGDDAAA